MFWCFCLILVLWLNARKEHERLRRSLNEAVKKFQSLTWYEWMEITIIGLILSLTFMIAVLSPPNNFDSMTYHMARVSEWIQHQNVRFYPTSIPRQNHAMPLAEYAILHLQLLSKSDQFANLVQWLSFLISILVASLVAKELNVSKSGQVSVGVLVATIPMAILQSSSTQNDLVVGALCLIFAYFLIRVIQRMYLADVLFASLALGLALLTKGTAYLYCAGIGLGLSGINLLFSERLHKKKDLVGLLILIVLGALVINTGHYVRNINIYGFPISTAYSRISVDRISIGNTVANLIRNIAIHLSTPFKSYNEGITKGVQRILGQYVNNPASTFVGEEFKVAFIINEDYIGNFFHFILVLFTLPMLLGAKHKNKIKALCYASGFLLAGLFYNVAIKWQPWTSRLQTPLFLFAMPLVVYLIERINRSKIILAFLCVFLFLYSLPFLFLNETRPLVPLREHTEDIVTRKVKKYFSDRPKRYEQYSSVLSPFFQDRSVLYTERKQLYFASNLYYYEDYIRAMEVMEEQKADVVGLYLGSNDWEYPLWVLSDKHAVRKKPIFIHIGVENETKYLLRDPYILPDLVIATKEVSKGVYFQEEYKEIFESENVDLLIRK
ncbi:MAG: glycosyltransferase family 39 protein [Desulfatiglandales bacterium]